MTWQNKQNECAPSKDSDQPGHPPSLIRVFAVQSIGSWGPKVSSCRQPDQTGRMPRLIWVFAGRTLTLFVLSCCSSNVLKVVISRFKPRHDKTNKVAVRPAKTQIRLGRSDQHGHLPSLIRVFAFCMKKACVLSYPLSAQQTLIRLGWCPGWSKSSLGVPTFCWLCHVVAHLYSF